MKRIFTLILFTTFFTNAFSQKKPKPEFRTVGTSDIAKNDKWKEDFKIKKEKFNIYLGYQAINSDLRQINGDTLEVYKITFDKRKSSEMEITKYATRNGKIIREGFYKVENDTLTVINDDYDYIGAFRMTDKYVTDKYGLKKISGKMKGIDTENLSDKYQKPAEMKAPLPAKN
ncbi:hypothetical protein H9X96_14730 [Pedobacter sp. N36a]|uniref:hypothetical protein n=1 Tax=Pedobacter sp. N36a TaxID=2767996 RepID=UPI0016573370|nr:hypothetical protein [Pedobacter sp. N36a]MBC8987026.1 hypothetical protein [Pedobacter sp. N36a]